MNSDDGPSWVDKKPRPRPSPLVGSSVEVSRQSGLSVTSGTFGKSDRFGNSTKVIGHGASSPCGHLFYSRNQLYKTAFEQEKSCSLGIGARAGADLPGSPPNVGPGSYPIVHSAKGTKSALDGVEYSTTTMKIKLPSSLTAVSMPSPGPAKYEVRGDLDGHLPRYGKQLLSHSGRDHLNEDSQSSDPGPGAYNDDLYKTVCISASCPNLRNGGERCMEAAGGTKRCLKSTFGVAARFSKHKAPNSSPEGDRYYAHSKILDGEAYLTGARTCSFGVSPKTDMSNPLKGPRHNTSPTTYHPQPGYSAAGRTSALDGTTSRMVSPVHQFSKNMGSPKKRSPQGGTSSMGVLLGAGGSSG